jgi:hypothetical protein
MDLDEILKRPQFSLAPGEKAAAMLSGLSALTRRHRENCPQYARLLNVLHPDLREPARMEDVPYLPVGLFKSHELKSIPESEVYKVLTSSGTTSSRVSRIVLDRATAERQTRALASIVGATIGRERMPMLIVDSKDFLSDRKSFNARAAAILGFSSFGRDHAYALKNDLTVDQAAVKDWLAAHGKTPFLIFGMTFLAWTFCREAADLHLDLSRGTLVHGGGWKKLKDQAVSPTEFKRRLSETVGLRRVHDYYGMVEQVGGIFMECDRGYLHAPNFSEIIVRDPVSWKPAARGAEGVVQVLSLIPMSYPGHSLLTEDLGTLAGEDGCSCGRRGTYFTISGRVPQAELRGCSDVAAGARA